MLQSLLSKPIVLLSAIGLGLAFAASIGGYFWLSKSSSGPALVYYTATSSDLPIVVTERGYLESQEQTTIMCQVETYDRNSGSSGLQILSIVPNGSVVKEGELLVELDSAAIRDRLESEELEFQSDKSALLQAEARRENQITQNATSKAQAKLDLELAKLDRQMYLDEKSGSFKLSVEEIERQIDEARNSILEAQAALKLQETEKSGIEELFRLGYKGKSDLDQSRFSFMKSEAALAAAVNRLSNHEASRRQLETYEYKKELLRLDGAVETAVRSLKQVEVTNASELAQVEAQLFEARERVSRQEARIRQYKRQLQLCKIYAPHDGMVVYARPGQSRYGSTRIAEGASVRNRQELLKLPDLTQMQVRTQIHEAVLDQIAAGLPVNIRVDAFPNRNFRGVISEVAVVPSQNSNTNAKTYDCVVQIPEIVNQLKPGMTAVCEINVDRLQDVISVPVQSIVQREDVNWLYVNGASGLEKRDVELGKNNDKFVHVMDGLDVGEQVVLNPEMLVKNEQQSAKDISPDDGVPDSDEQDSQNPETLIPDSNESITQKESERTDNARSGKELSRRRNGQRSRRREDAVAPSLQNERQNPLSEEGNGRPGKKRREASPLDTNSTQS